MFLSITPLQPPKLTFALGKSVSHIQQIAGQKYVLSLSRNSEGVFAIYLNSVLVFSHTDNRPFHRISGNEDAEYRFRGTHFANSTTLKLYCQLHLSKDLSKDMIKRIHAELMKHYLFLFDELMVFRQLMHTFAVHVSVPKAKHPNLRVCSCQCPAITFDQVMHDLKFGLIKVLQCIEDSSFLCLSEIPRRGRLE